MTGKAAARRRHSAGRGLRTAEDGGLAEPKLRPAPGRNSEYPPSAGSSAADTRLPRTKCQICIDDKASSINRDFTDADCAATRI